MQLKVCGITSREQYRAVAMLGADYIGLNFYRKSKRYLSEQIQPLDAVFATKNVGVFVDPDIDEVASYTAMFNLDYIQLHGNESPDFCEMVSMTVPVIKVFGVDDNFSFDKTNSYTGTVDYFLFDTKTKQYGGSGKRFNWSKLNEYQGTTPFFLSGGIGPADLDRIITIKHPGLIGLDINSGFESSPGVKNIKLIEEFITRIKNEKS